MPGAGDGGADERTEGEVWRRAIDSIRRALTIGRCRVEGGARREEAAAEIVAAVQRSILDTPLRPCAPVLAG